MPRRLPHPGPFLVARLTARPDLPALGHTGDSVLVNPSLPTQLPSRQDLPTPTTQAQALSGTCSPHHHPPAQARGRQLGKPRARSLEIPTTGNMVRCTRSRVCPLSSFGSHSSLTLQPSCHLWGSPIMLHTLPPLGLCPCQPGIPAYLPLHPPNPCQDLLADACLSITAGVCADLLGIPQSRLRATLGTTNPLLDHPSAHSPSPAALLTSSRETGYSAGLAKGS